MNERFNGIGWVVRQRAFYVAVLLWLLLCGVGSLCSRHTPRFRGLVVGSSQYLVLVVLMLGLVALLTRKRPVIDLGQRSPERSIARRETLAMWAYAALVMVAGRLIGQHLFGEGMRCISMGRGSGRRGCSRRLRFIRGRPTTGSCWHSFPILCFGCEDTQTSNSA